MSNEINVGAISEALNNKVDLNQLNTNEQGLEYVSGIPMPSDRYVDLTLGASGSSYTAPANGWVLCSKRLGANEGLFLLSQNSQGQRLCEYSVRTPSLSDQGGSIPVKKNQRFFVYYDGTGAVEFFRFVYAEGDE